MSVESNTGCAAFAAGKLFNTATKLRHTTQERIRRVKERERAGENARTEEKERMKRA